MKRGAVLGAAWQGSQRATLAAAKQRIADHVATHGQGIVARDSALQPLLVALLAGHPQVVRWIQPVDSDGIQFRIAANARSTDRQAGGGSGGGGDFTIHVTNASASSRGASGRERVMSLRTCVTGRLASADSLLRRAMRSAVEDQIAECRQSAGRETACAICAQPIGVPSGPLHVHHAAPDFEQLVQTFLAQTAASGQRARVPSRFASHRQTHACVFRDDDPVSRDFAHRWQQFHRQHAVLQLAHARCNLQAGRQSAADSCGTLLQSEQTHENKLK